MLIGIPLETHSGETRVAATPETVKKLVSQGHQVTVQSSAGSNACVPDSAYEQAGAKIGSAAEAFAAALVLKVVAPDETELALMKPGAVLIGMLNPFDSDSIARMAARGIMAFALEAAPRTSRAQSLDVLSSQANIAGYKAVMLAANHYPRFMPMLMTAAGTVPAARVFVMGAGVAGLQAIATARRLGAVVTATDVRPAAKEQVESLGAKFVAVEDEEFKQAETAAGYAKPMSAEYQAKQAALVAEHIKKQDIVITTALIPGRPAPRLVSADMVRSMKPGSVLIDLAVERGGNVEGARLGEVVTTPEGIRIVGHKNVPGRIAATASQLYAKNLFAFVETLIDKKEKVLAVNWDDELVKATALTREGAVIHPAFLN